MFFNKFGRLDFIRPNSPEHGTGNIIERSSGGHYQQNPLETQPFKVHNLRGESQ
jgi:hypothetical protein